MSGYTESVKRTIVEALSIDPDDLPIGVEIDLRGPLQSSLSIIEAVEAERDNLLEALEAIQTLAETPINSDMDLKLIAAQAREAIAKAGGAQ